MNDETMISNETVSEDNTSKELPKMVDYVGIQHIKACPMSYREYIEYLGQELPKDANSDDTGYFMQLDDGEHAWFPKNLFDSTYTAVGTDPYRDAALMWAGDYKSRFKAEYFQNSITLQKLIQMINLWDNGKLDYEPACPRSTYTMQIEYLSKYLGMLEARAKIEDIQL